MTHPPQAIRRADKDFHMSASIRALTGDFPAKSPEDWERLAETALKGRDFARTLVRRTPAGLDRGPVGFDSGLDRPANTLPRDANSHLPWAICQSISIADPVVANAAILEDLQGGTSAIELKLQTRAASGIAVQSYAKLAQVLKGVDAQLAPVWLSAGTTVAQAGWLADWFQNATHDTSTLRGGFGLSADDEEAFEFAVATQHQYPLVEVIRIDARSVHDAGGNEVQELAFAAAGAASAMRGMIAAGLSADDAVRRIGLTLAVDTDIHLGIAKLRAARRIWADIMSAFGVSPQYRRGHLHAVTSFRMMSRQDPWTNLIRTATAGFAGAAGTADALTIRPLTDAIGRSTAFGRRIARNLHILLQEESHVGRAADPAGGAFLHESLREELAQRAWTAFQALESAGGFAAAISSPHFAAEIAEAHGNNLKSYATGRQTMVGTTAYAQVEARPAETSDADWSANLPASPFKSVRLAAPFEALRDRADAASASGKPPLAFLATLGEMADFNARATFATQRMAVGGIESTEANVHASQAATVLAFQDSGAELAIICGTDEAYAEDARALVDALKAAGAKAVWIAGAPNDALPGADHFIHLRSNTLEDISLALDVMGVA
tara:strand:+ start:11288 stop:13123 length:1836 start_codon:yes stop_codon:yes gene_type:complete